MQDSGHVIALPQAWEKFAATSFRCDHSLPVIARPEREIRAVYIAGSGRLGAATGFTIMMVGGNDGRASGLPMAGRVISTPPKRNSA